MLTSPLIAEPRHALKKKTCDGNNEADPELPHQE